MKEQILENIYHLYKSHVVTTIIFLVLIVLTIIVSVGAIKFEVVKTLREKIVLITIVIICSVLLTISQIVTIVPVYKDYQDSSYIIVEGATVVIKDDSSGILDRSSTVSVRTQKEEYELNMRTDLKLDANVEYYGTIVFLKHSKYIVWYEFG